MKKLLFIAILIPFFIACGGNKEVQNEQKVYTVDELTEVIDGIVDSTIFVEGKVVHICRHGGMKMFLEGSDDERRIKIVADKEAFDTSFVEQVVVVEGIVEEFRLDQAYIDALMADAIAENSLNAEEVEHDEHSEHAEGNASEPTCHHLDMLEHVKQFQQQLDESGKEYLSFFSIKCISVKVKETEE